MKDFINKEPSTARILAILLVEIFFATLPLIVLGTTWPSEHERHPATFLRSPEISMTSCILYGLTLTRYQEGVFEYLRAGPAGDRLNVHNLILMSLIPLMGVILSVVLIAKLAAESDSLPLAIAQFANVVMSILIFLFIGGWGVYRSEMMR